jgi:hypothetical protein
MDVYEIDVISVKKLPVFAVFLPGFFFATRAQRHYQNEAADLGKIPG